MALGKKKKSKSKKQTKAAKKKARKASKAAKKKLRKDTKAKKKEVRQDKKAKLKKVRKSDASHREKRSKKKKIRKSAKTKKKKVTADKKTKKKEIKSEKKKAIAAAVKGWSNWLGDFTTKGRRYSPPSKNALKQVIQSAVDARKKLKVIGSGHSHSKAAKPMANEWYVDIAKISGLLDLDEKTLRRKPKKNSLVRVKAGTRLQALHSQLLAPKGMGLLNMGSFDGQTVAGAVNTNTHGTGIKFGGFGDMVQSADVFVVVPNAELKPSVELWRIEPSNGMTNPAHAGTLRREGVTRLIQDDKVFHAAVVGYGSTGIAFSYVLAVQDLYWLSEKTEACTVADFKQKMRRDRASGKPKFVTEARHTWAFVNIAWAQVFRGDKKSGDPRSLDETSVQLMRQKVVPTKAIPKSFKHKIHPIWPPMRKRGSFLKNIFRDIAQKHLNSEKRAGRFVANAINKNFIETDGSGFFHTKNCSAYYRVLRRSRDETLKTTNAPKSKWDNTRLSGTPDAPTLAISMEICVPVTKTGDAIDAILKAVKNEEVNYSAPVGIRFSAGSKHYMSPAYGRDSAFMELAGVIERKKTRAEDLQRYKKSFNRVYAQIEKAVPGLRPHLGKHQNFGYDEVTAAYPRARAWMEIQSCLNYTGIWTSPITQQLGAQKHRKTAQEARRWSERL